MHGSRVVDFPSRIRLDPGFSFKKKPAIPSGMAGFFLAIGKLMEFPWRFICKLDWAAVFKVFIHRLNCKSFSSLHTPNAPLALYQGERPPHSPILFRIAQWSPPLHRLSPISTILWPSFPVIWPSGDQSMTALSSSSFWFQVLDCMRIVRTSSDDLY